jgi:hypothetical protein
MGTNVWVCFACNEKLKEERWFDTERLAGAAEGGQESADAEQKRAAQAAAAIQQRSDADIAEATSTTVLREYTAFAKRAHDAAGGNTGFNHEAAFMYFLAVSLYSCRRFLSLELDSARLDRIQETAGRYALAGFIHGMVRNTAEAVGDEPIRQKLLSTMVERYRTMSGVHQQNLEHLLKSEEKTGSSSVPDTAGSWPVSGSMTSWKEKMMFAYLLPLPLEWFGKDFADASVEGKTRMTQCAGNALFQGMGVAPFLQPQLATLGSPVNRDIELRLPESWILREERPSAIGGKSSFRYYDPSTPQYALMVSAGAPLSRTEAPEALLRRILPTVSPAAVPVSLGPERAIAH